MLPKLNLIIHVTNVTNVTQVHINICEEHQHASLSFHSSPCHLRHWPCCYTASYIEIFAVC